jgi:uncharacterized protein YceK
MRKVALALGLAIAAASLSGCGTFSDAMCGPINDHIFYRGVRFDMAMAKQGGGDTLMLADLPLSAVADTALLPFSTAIAITALTYQLTHPDLKKDKSEPHEAACGAQEPREPTQPD